MVDRDYKPFGSVRDAMDAMAKLDQAGTNAEIRNMCGMLQGFLERESNKGSARARELAALLRKHSCPLCVRGTGSQRTTWYCGECIGGKLLESQIPFKERMNLSPLTQPCEQCKGNGSVDGKTACRNCGGTGEEAIYGRRQNVGGKMRLTKERRLPAHTGKEPVYNCPRCNGTEKVAHHCVLCNDTGIINRAEYERELQRIENYYR